MSNSVPFIKRKMLLLKASQTGYQKKKIKADLKQVFQISKQEESVNKKNQVNKKKKKGKESLKNEVTHCN